MKKNFQIIAIVLILITTITACSSQRSTLFVDDKCNLPCWRGIEFGMTREDVKAFLSEMEDIRPLSISFGESSSRSLNTSISVLFEGGTFRKATFYFADDNLKVMVFQEPLNDNDELGYWIKELGQPDQLSLYGGELTRFAMWHSYYYFDSPICLFGKPSKEKNIYKIDEKTPIESVVISDLTYDRGLAKIDCYSDFFSDQIQEWSGFQEYNICPNQESLCD